MSRASPVGEAVGSAPRGPGGSRVAKRPPRWPGRAVVKGDPAALRCAFLRRLLPGSEVGRCR